MGKLIFDISMSLDGFVAGPDQNEGAHGRLERTRIVESPTGVTHLSYRVFR